ncbi:MAG: Holliday junction resolvase RuvX [Candidatus Parcubacteria bacterium]|nr:Holliday junction resolvase RuvX [Candidatus Parcubacteria bacterium]
MFILGLDLGIKRIGLALGDTKAKAIFMLPTLRFKNISVELIPALKKIIDKWQVESLVIGQPLSLNLEETTSSKNQTLYINQIKKLSLPIYLENEMLTSKEAENILNTKQLSLASYKKIVQAGDIDKVSAYLILESYFKKNDYLGTNS